MNATLKATLVEFLPGPKAVTIGLTSLMLFLDHWLKLGINEAKVIAASVTIGTYVATHTNTWGDLLTGTYWEQFIPTPKVLTMLIAPLLVLIDHKFKLNIPTVKIAALAGTLSIYLLTTLKKTAKIAPAVPAPAPAAPFIEALKSTLTNPAGPQDPPIKIIGEATGETPKPMSTGGTPGPG